MIRMGFAFNGSYHYYIRSIRIILAPTSYASGIADYAVKILSRRLRRWIILIVNIFHYQTGNNGKIYGKIKLTLTYKLS